MQDKDAVAETKDHLHLVFDEKDGSLGGELLDERDHVLGLFGSHAGSWFVEQQQLRIGHQRDRDLQRALLAMGQKFRHFVATCGEPYGRERGIGPLIEFRQLLAVGPDIVARTERLALPRARFHAR